VIRTPLRTLNVGALMLSSSPNKIHLSAHDLSSPAEVVCVERQAVPRPRLCKAVQRDAARQADVAIYVPKGIPADNAQMLHSNTTELLCTEATLLNGR